MKGVDVIVEDERWRAEIADIEALASLCFETARSKEPRIDRAATILFTDDAALRALNREFRAKDAPTNVLSFEGAGESLGDVALAFETCACEANEQGVSMRDHAAHLVVHGLLHLAGHDHAQEGPAEIMETLEIAVLDGMGVSNPYKDEVGD
jgi:probable rRNA maturation factor